MYYHVPCQHVPLLYFMHSYAVAVHCLGAVSIELVDLFTVCSHLQILVLGSNQSFGPPGEQQYTLAKIAGRRWLANKLSTKRSGFLVSEISRLHTQLG